MNTVSAMLMLAKVTTNASQSGQAGYDFLLIDCFLDGARSQRPMRFFQNIHTALDSARNSARNRWYVTVFSVKYGKLSERRCVSLAGPTDFCQTSYRV